MVIKRKVVLLGDSAVGKTSLVRRYVYNVFSESYIQTIGTKVSKKNLSIDHDGVSYNISMVIWDVLGQQGYTNVQRAAFRGSDGAIFVCDLTRKDTLHSILHYWLPTLESVVGAPGVLLANKNDLHPWEIGLKELDDFSKLTGLPYFVTSAKTGESVEEAFEKLAELMMIYRPIRTTEEKIAGIKTTKDVLDYIMADFCKHYGNWNDAMAIVEANIRMIGLDMRNPERHQLYILIEKLYYIEMYSLGMEKAQENKARRLGVLRAV